MKRIIPRIILQFIAGIVFAFGVGICVWALSYSLTDILELDSFILNLDNTIYSILFLGLPIGGLLGISMVDKLIFKSQGYNKLGIVIGFSLSTFGTVLVGWILPIFDIRFFDWILPVVHINIDILVFPFVVAFFAVIGYNSIRLFSFFKQ